MPFNSVFVAYVGFILMMAVVSSVVVEREMCLAQALAIHAVMKQEKCPDNLLNVDTVSERCSVLCKGLFITKTILIHERHCVGFNITFNLDYKKSTKFRDFPCGISRCFLEVIDFECFNEPLRNRDQGSGTGCTGNLNFELTKLLSC
uniref:Uncharacterized protein LOC111105983 n=1 Tax=Crassostrea virginica TaxID=6565 RepID=A0A8B8B0T0_CRAVI|nr:uncharacterized protein LOC111105983 [Crassostrea virginica]